MKPHKTSGMEKIPRPMGMSFEYVVTLSYLLLAGLWIYFTDKLVALFSSTNEQMRIFSTYKGFLFIAFTATLLFIVLKRFVSKIRLTQKHLQDREEKLCVTLNSIGDAVVSTDTAGNVVHLNPVAESLTGWSQKEAIGKPLEKVFKIINEQTRQPVENPVDKVLAAGTIVGMANHTLLITKDGRELPIADSGAPIKNETGKTTGVVMVFRDQTEERAAQEALIENERALHKSQIIAGLGTYVLNIQTGLWKSSDMMNKVLGIDENHVRSADSWPNMIHPDDRTIMVDYFKNEVLGQGKPFNKEYRIIRHNDRAERWVHGLGELEFNTQGIPLKMHGTIQDITERKQAEVALKQQADELQKNNDYLTRFTRIVTERELRMIELKREINDLNSQLGRPQPYLLNFDEPATKNPEASQ